VGAIDDPLTSPGERSDLVALLALPEGAALLEVGAAAPRVAAGSHDAVLCIDGIARVADRAATLAAWARAVKPGGKILYTDPAIVAGLVTSEEVAARSGGATLTLSAQGDNESLLEETGLRLLRADDATDGAAGAAAAALEAGGPGAVPFLEAAHRLYASRRLVRIAFLAVKSS
jgi:hypothetical protein